MTRTPCNRQRLPLFLSLPLAALLMLLAVPTATAQSPSVPSAAERAALAPAAPALLEVVGEAPRGSRLSATLTAEQATVLTHIAAREASGATVLVRLPESLAPLPALAFGYTPDHRITADTSPPGGGKITAVREDFTIMDDDTYGWSGRLYAGDQLEHEVGSISFTYTNGVGYLGQVQVRANLFAIHPLGGGLHALTDIIEAAFEDDEGPDGSLLRSLSESPSPTRDGATSVTPTVTPTAETEGNGEPLYTEGGSCGGIRPQRVLVLYTVGAFNAVSDISSVINDAIYNSNQAYSRSRIYNVKLELAERRGLSSFREMSSARIDLLNFRVNPTAQAWRDQYKADLVVLLTKPNAYGSVKGLAPVYTPGLTDSDDAYAIVDVDAAVGGRVFTHEVGHMQGGQHHPDDQGVDPDLGYDYGRGHRGRWSSCIGGFGWLCGYDRFATIMAYTRGGVYPRINNISNPDVEYDGVNTGWSSRNNARVFRTTDSVIEAFRSEPAPPLSASISTSGNSSTGQYTFTASTCGGTGTKSYEWRVRHGTGNYGSVVSTSSSYSTTVPVGETWVKLTVRTSSGEVDDAYAYVYREGGGCPPYDPNCGCVPRPGFPCPDRPAGGSGDDPLAAPAFAASLPAAVAVESVSPNPLSSGAEVRFVLPAAAEVSLAVFDALGREVARLAEGPMEAGEHRARFDASGLPAGAYVVRLQAGGVTTARSVTLVR